MGYQLQELLEVSGVQLMNTRDCFSKLCFILLHSHVQELKVMPLLSCVVRKSNPGETGITKWIMWIWFITAFRNISTDSMSDVSGPWHARTGCVSKKSLPASIRLCDHNVKQKEKHIKALCQSWWLTFLKHVKNLRHGPNHKNLCSGKMVV